MVHQELSRKRNNVDCKIFTELGPKINHIFRLEEKQKRQMERERQDRERQKQKAEDEERRRRELR